MEMTSIEKWLPAPGELLEFVPTAETLAAARNGSLSTARPSSIQAGHIRTAIERRSRGLDWSPWVAIAFHVPAPLNRQALCRAFNAFVTRHGTLLSWFEGDVDNLRRRVIPSEAVTLKIARGGDAQTTGQVREKVTERFAGNTSPLSWPSFAAGAIDHDAGRDGPPGSPTAGFTVYYGVDHSHTDGVSMLYGVQELRELYERQVTGNTEPLPPVGSYVDFSAAERELEETLTLASPPVAVWLSALGQTGFRLPSFPLPLGLEPGETASAVRTHADIGDAATIDAFEKVARSAGGGMAAAMFAALSTVDTELAGRSLYLALNAVATRFDPIYATAQGWFVNVVPIAADLSQAETFEQRVGAMQSALERSRAAAAMPARAVVDAVTSATGGGAQVSATTVPPMVSYIDMRRFAGAELPGTDQIVALGGPGNTGDVSLWINRKRQRTYVMASYPNTPTAHASVTDYLAALGDVITRTVGAAAVL
ncbi:MAG TPA: condensation domain-containing protein [Solirubrobacteraceae bacterium]|jgi:hypothetical protein|nr:condensation domain-containing protein [Solirubrobacteraceae bacterium]